MNSPTHGAAGSPPVKITVEQRDALHSLALDLLAGLVGSGSALGEDDPRFHEDLRHLLQELGNPGEWDGSTVILALPNSVLLRIFKNLQNVTERPGADWDSPRTRLARQACGQVLTIIETDGDGR